MSAISCTCGRCEACARWNKPATESADVVGHLRAYFDAHMKAHAAVEATAFAEAMAAANRARDAICILERNEGGDAPRAA